MISLISHSTTGSDSVTVNGLCKALSISRSSYYRSCAGRVDPDLELRDQIQKLAIQWPCYGYRPMTRALQRLGYTVNRKRVLRLMREDNLLSLRKRRFVPTTDSNHDHQVYANLVPELVITDINQLWVADITYIRLHAEWIYLAVVLDAHSRRCIGWALDRTLEADLAISALKKALATRPAHCGLVHHSDRGVQYASNTYVQTLKQADIRISMSRRGNPYDNAKAESFIKTLKYEEVYLYEYESLEDARDRIGYFIDTLYNQKRLHSALDYRPPAEFEQEMITQNNGSLTHCLI
jgi:transposase InsO family protein|tara:strand:+ start:501 stop:1382 length:882 start_codon:yes stop_codon:yes gene_type:complete